MSQKPRLWIEEATYHTRSRCIEKKFLMKSDKMKELMMHVLNMALEKYSFELSGYTIMDNHFHFYIRTVKNGENISRIMQFIKAQYAQRYNRMMKRTGPFWNERFTDTIIELSKNPIYLFFLILFYLANNPVRSKMVNDPRKYKYSSINSYLDENSNSPVKITLHKYFIELGNNFEERVKKMLEYEDLFRKRIFDKCLFS